MRYFVCAYPQPGTLAQAPGSATLLWRGGRPLWTVGEWPGADRVVVSGNGWRLAALGTVTASLDKLHCAGERYDRTLDPAVLSGLPGRAHLVWSDTETDLGDTILVGQGEAPIFYTEHRDVWYAASAAVPLSRIGGGVAGTVQRTCRGHALVLTAIGVAETQITAPDSPETSGR